MTVLLEQGAEFSADRIYRYTLWRRWAEGPRLMVVGLNPSTADETQDDPTVRRCVGFAKTWGYSGLVMLNLFAFRATDPKVMLAAPDPVGPRNLDCLEWFARWIGGSLEHGGVLAAWGNHGLHREQWLHGRWALTHGTSDTWSRNGVACLGRTKLGQPKHPLYLAATTPPEIYAHFGGDIMTRYLGYSRSQVNAEHPILRVGESGDRRSKEEIWHPEWHNRTSEVSHD